MTIETTNAAIAYNKTNALGTAAANNNGNLTSFNSSFIAFNQALQEASTHQAGEMMVANEITRVNKVQNKGKLSSIVSETANNIYDTLKKSEDVSSKAIVDDADISDVVSTVSNAEIALQSIVSIRDKVISAYQDVMKMQI